VKASETLGLPGSRETMDRVMNSVEDLIAYNLPKITTRPTPERCAR